MSAVAENSSPDLIQKPIAVVPDPSHLSFNDYIGWFEKININTLVWQLIVIFTLIIFRHEVRALMQVLIDKIPQLKSVGGAEFSSETKEAVEGIPDRLQKEIEAYEIVAEKDPNIVFLTIFVDIESKIREICTNYYLNDDLAWLRASPLELFRSLIRNEVLDPKAMPIFHDVRALRNRIAHGEKPFNNLIEAKSSFEALVLLKDMVQEGLEKVLQGKNVQNKSIK